MRAALKADVERYGGHIQESFQRSRKLTAVAAGSAESKDDILRAVVVMTHAYLEDFLRTIGRTFFPHADEQTLNEIPLAGLPGRAEKFQLGHLLRHKDK